MKKSKKVMLGVEKERKLLHIAIEELLKLLVDLKLFATYHLALIRTLGRGFSLQAYETYLSNRH